MKYNDNFVYPASEPLTVNGSKVICEIISAQAPLKLRREEMSLSQQDVASAAGITLRQYQRFESGERSMSSASLRIGLSICQVLRLDPYRFIHPTTSK